MKALLVAAVLLVSVSASAQVSSPVLVQAVINAMKGTAKGAQRVRSVSVPYEVTNGTRTLQVALPGYQMTLENGIVVQVVNHASQASRIAVAANKRLDVGAAGGREVMNSYPEWIEISYLFPAGRFTEKNMKSAQEFMESISSLDKNLRSSGVNHAAFEGVSSSTTVSGLSSVTIDATKASAAEAAKVTERLVIWLGAL